jgi:hypothetical protein
MSQTMLIQINVVKILHGRLKAAIARRCFVKLSGSFAASGARARPALPPGYALAVRAHREAPGPAPAEERRMTNEQQPSTEVATCLYALGGMGTCRRCGAWLGASRRALMRRPRRCSARFPMGVPAGLSDEAKRA